MEKCFQDVSSMMFPLHFRFATVPSMTGDCYVSMYIYIDTHIMSRVSLYIIIIPSLYNHTILTPSNIVIPLGKRLYDDVPYRKQIDS